MSAKIIYLLRRSFAYAIDCIIVYSVVMLIIQWAVLSNLRSMIGLTDDWFRNPFNLQLYVWLSISLPVYLYFTYFDSHKSRGTFGKRLMHLKVHDTSLNQITISKSFLRALMKLLPWEIAHIGVIFPVPIYFMDEPVVRHITYIGIILFLAYFLSIIVRKNNQTPYDQLLGTFVSPR